MSCEDWKIVFQDRFRASCYHVLGTALLLALLALPAHSQPLPEPALEITLAPFSLTIDGGKAAVDFAVFGVGRDRVAYQARTLRFDEVVTADEAGVARFELPDGEAVPARSVWAAVDLATGVFALAAPEGVELRRIEAPARGLGAAARVLEQDGRMLDVLLVRPVSGPEGEDAAGLWALRAGDGGLTDDDGEANGRLSLRVLDLMPLAGSPPAPETLAPRDVVIGVDPQTLEIYAVQLAAPPADGEES